MRELALKSRAGALHIAEAVEQIPGLRVVAPPESSLVCIGDTDLARHATPGISALTWDLDQKGRVAANILLDRISGDDTARKVRPVYLPTRFILRHSGAKPRAP